MRLVSYRRGQASGIAATLRDGRLLDIATVDPSLPRDMTAFLAAGDDALRQVAAAVAAAPAGAGIDPAAVTFLAPVTRPGKIICIGYNYRGHTPIDDPPYPDVFAKVDTTVNHPGAPIVLPAASNAVDYEAELAVVIGTTAHEVAEADAIAHIAGYTILNDVSARDWQDHGSQWVPAKSFDGFAPMGPALVTKDEVPDPHDLDVTLTVNGEVTISASTRTMVFSVPFLVSYLSQVMTLRPGDIIATGTPQKLPEVLARGNRWLQAGDDIAITFGDLGTLSNPVASSSSTEHHTEGARS